MSLKHLSLFLILTLSAVTADAKNYYRFKDSNGRLVVKDYLPNLAIKSGYDIVNEDGRLIERVPPTKTEKEKEAERIRQQKLAEQEKKEREARRHDRLLLRQYHTVDDIKRTEKSQTATLQINISILQGRNKTLKNKLSDLQSNAADFERKGKAVPQSTLKQIAATKEQIAENEESITRYQDQVEVIKEQFKSDLVRFKELKAKNMVDGYASEQQVQAAAKVQCDTNQACQRSWKLAQIFAHENASNKLEIVTDSLIISTKPLTDEQIGLSITQVPTKNGTTQIILEVQCMDSEAGQQLCQSDNIAQLKQKFVQYISQD